MKIKSIKEQLIELGFKTGDKINLIGWFSNNNPFIIDFEREELGDRENHWCSFENLIGEKFEKVQPTKEEIIEDLKKRSKKFEKGMYNWYLYMDLAHDKIYATRGGMIKQINEIYFDRETAQKICEELNADREKTKILFDLED